MILKSLDYFFDSAVQNSVFVNIAIKLLGPVLRLLYHTKIRGLSNLQTALAQSKQTGTGLIIAANHRSNLDAVLMIVELERYLRMRPIAKAELFKVWAVARIAAWYGAFPIQRGESDLKAIKRACAILKRGEHLLIFPEGTRVKDTSPASSALDAKAQAGVALIADMTQADILPVHISTHTNPSETRIEFGSLLDVATFDNLADKSQRFQLISAHLIKTIYSI